MNLLRAVAADSGAGKDDTVVEIGAGAGGLTLALSEAAGKVCAFEVDNSLESILKETLKDCANTQVIFKDVLKMSDAEIAEIAGESFCVAANLPYYITTPLIMRFLESSLGVKSLTVMVQKEVAERITARHNTKEYSSITLAVDFYADAEIKRIVGRNMFFPVPNVDSALLKLTVVPDKYKVKNKEKFLKFLNSAFYMRRKTFANNLNAVFGLEKEKIGQILSDCGYSQSIRGEALAMADFLKLYERIF
jgi:16S rRNA (adenine1518-N6/adenine1519-N6)-dimethyltransferase